MSRSSLSRPILGFILPLTLSSFTAYSQQQQQQPSPAPGPGTTQPGNPPGQTSPGGRPGTSPGQQPFPGRDQQQQQQMEDMMRNRPIMLSGKVMMDDGTPPPETVVIERVCNGIVRPEGYTDTKGRFNFTLGQNQAMMPDASTGSDIGMPGRDMGTMGGSRGGFGGMGPMGGRGGITERDLIGCEIRANLAGFRSSIVQLAGRRSLDNPDVGTIILHRLAKVDGFTFSGTTAFAPKDAKKAYEKAQKAVKKKNLDEAEVEYRKAVELYPKYALGWNDLGRLLDFKQKKEEARDAYLKSIEADGKFINPYINLAKLMAVDKKWEEAADYSEKLVKLNPYVPPDAYFISGVAHLNLNKLDIAEQHTRAALKQDEKNQNPRIIHLLGVILAQKQDIPGAAEQMRTYLKLVPNGPDSENVKQQLAGLEKMLAGKEGSQSQAAQ